MQRLRLKKDLRREILRGHPWIYKNALGTFDQNATPGLAVLEDKKGKFLALGVVDPKSSLAFRVLTTNKETIDHEFFEKRFFQAKQRKVHLKNKHNDSFRLLNGEGDGAPGLICDIYADVAVLQADGQQLHEFWDMKHLAKWLCESDLARHVYFKSREPRLSSWLFGGGKESIAFLENDICWEADIVHGQKTGFFLDQRNNRLLIRKLASNKSVLNLFSYTGGFSVSAGLGGATNVTSVDLSAPAIAMCEENWRRNGLDPAKHGSHATNVFDFLSQANEFYDIVIVDPPSFASSEASVEKATSSYIRVFSESAKVAKPRGLLAWASCSSHITFDMFYSIVLESISKARKKARVLQILGQPEDHPFPLACPELRYLKFFLLQLI